MFEFINAQHEHSFMTAHDTILMFANSQGFYSRLLQNMEYSDWQPLYELTMEIHFNEPLDFVFYIEC